MIRDDFQVPVSVSMILLLPSPRNSQVPWGDSLALERHGANLGVVMAGERFSQGELMVRVRSLR